MIQTSFIYSQNQLEIFLEMVKFKVKAYIQKQVFSYLFLAQLEQNNIFASDIMQNVSLAWSCYIVLAF